MSSSLRVRGATLLVSIAVLLGCGAPSQTVTVTDRPERTQDTTVEARDTVSTVASVASPYDTVQARRFDRGKLWPIHDLPATFFEERYGVTPDEEWRTHVMRAALRFGENCSASFVSEDGLVLTNHHCARDHVTAAAEEGESLLEEGFYAESSDAERRTSSLHVDQLIRVEDVTSRITDPSGRRARQMSRQARINQLEEQMTAEAKTDDERLRVDIISLYRGITYAAHTYRRYEDVRLVLVPERDLGFFGGETDNFTYPRHTLDVAFFRVYEDGEPFQPEHHFEWDTGGAEVGEPVFAAGNPGTTSRLQMVSQLQYERDHELPSRLEVLRSRSKKIRTYISENPETASKYDLQNTYFSIQNSIKSTEGQLRGLQDPYLLARRGQAVRALQDSLRMVDSLRQYTTAVGEIQRLQESKRVLADKNEAFVTFASTRIGSRILSRALHGYYLNFLRNRGVPANRLEDLRQDAQGIEDWPPKLEESVLASQLEEIRAVYGADHPSLKRLFQGQSAEELANQLITSSALVNSTAFLTLLEEGYTQSDDPSVPLINALAPLYLNVTRQMNDFETREEELNRGLTRARRSIFDEPIPPDATFSLRVSDGIVKGYQKHGSPVPAFTNFYGLYDKYYSYSGEDWALPDTWVPPPASFDRGVPLNLVSTNDISGGSSGSPLLNRDLEVVGVAFDSNMEAIPNKYLYRTESARAISVDVRGIVEALEHVYGADRLVEEVVDRPETSAEAASTPSN